MKTVKPKALGEGDTVRVVAVSSPFEKESFLNGVAILKSLGLKVKYRRDVFSKLPYLAGTDARRFAELKEALSDKDCRAIFFARGGYGAMRLIPSLEKWKFKPAPKIIAGFSDVTPLHLYLQKRFGWTMQYAPVVGGNLRQLDDPFTFESFKNALFRAEPLGSLRFGEMVAVKSGKAEGILAGGCLTLVAHSLGTPHEIETAGRILFFEDVHEKPYQVDRLLTHLKLAGKFRKCRGVIFGGLNGPNPFEHYVETVSDVLGKEGFPILMGFPAGHIKRTFTLPLGVKVRFDARAKTVEFLEAALS